MLVLLSLAASSVFATSLGTPGTPTVTTPITVGSTETVTSDITNVVGTGSAPIAYTLWVSSGGTYSQVLSAVCNAPGNTVTCTYQPLPGAYTYEVYATDSTPTTTMSPPSPQATVTRAATTVSVSCSPGSIALTSTGASTSTCRATVSGHTPTGTVSFASSGGTAKVSVPASCTLTQGGGTSSCAVTVTGLGAGSTTIVASYPNGDANNTASTSPGTTSLSVTAASTSTSVVCSPTVLVAGQQATCTATVVGYHPTGSVTWVSTDTAGVFSATPCTLGVSFSCGVTYTATTSATITAFYGGDANNSQSQGNYYITVNVNEEIQITVADSGPVTTVSLHGCSVSPNSITANGVPQSFTASSGCSGIVVQLPPPGTNTQYLTSSGLNSLTLGSCSANSCAVLSATIYYQTFNTYEAFPRAPGSWSSQGTISVTGTVLGVSNQQICGIAVSTGSGGFSCQGWSDYSTQATLGSLSLSNTQRWATAQSSFSDTTGGNPHKSSYYLQVLENFAYSFVGTTTAPSSPALQYTSFGNSTTFPLLGSASSVWLDSGSSWSVPASLSGSTSSERWQTLVTSGSASAGQTLSFVYYHQYYLSFGFNVSGGGAGYQPPTVTFTSFGASSTGNEGWIDAGTRYSYSNPLPGSTSAERWLSPSPSGLATAGGAMNGTYYHQFALSLSFNVTGGGPYSDPRLTLTALGAPAEVVVNATRGTVWVDNGAHWAVTPLLPSSTPSEQWITVQQTSGTATGPFTQLFNYYHQYLATIRYSILGSGGSPPVPQVNYTSLGNARASSVNTTFSSLWMDSSSGWSVSGVMPGVKGERWIANVTGTQVAAAPFTSVVQYAHQFYVQVGVSNTAGGGVANIDQWKQQGSTVILNATAADKWKLAYWQGSTPYSYNGTTMFPTLTVTGPANETAMFFPALTIFTNSQGSVQYTYGTVSGTVPPGSNATIYPPPGRNVTLTALPKTVEVMFQGWSGGLTSLQVQPGLAISFPGEVHASFATDYADIRTFSIATLFVFIAASYVFIVRRGFTPKMPAKRT
jgi:hypothetical protein